MRNQMRRITVLYVRIESSSGALLDTASLERKDNSIPSLHCSSLPPIYVSPFPSHHYKSDKFHLRTVKYLDHAIS
jgi:hypothetical protein